MTAEVTTSPTLRGPKQRIAQATRPNTLFLSKAAQENFEPLLAVYDWFVDPSVLGDVDAGLGWYFDNGVALLQTDPAYQPWLINLLAQADLGVAGVRLQPSQSQPSSALLSRLAKSDAPEALAEAEAVFQRQTQRPQLLHHSSLAGPGLIPWERESRGTQALWSLASDIYRSLQSGRALLIDELGSLHPWLIREILRTFQSKTLNPNNAQLIFTSHDLTLLGNWAGDGYMLDRDQIWFTEKDFDSGATSLIPLTDFSPRKDEDVERMYLQGRFGAVPSLGSMFDGWVNG